MILTPLINNNQVMMKHLSKTKLNAKESLVLEPLSYHVMLMGLTRQLKQGEIVKIWFNFEKSGKIEIGIPVVR